LRAASGGANETSSEDGETDETGNVSRRNRECLSDLSRCILGYRDDVEYGVEGVAGVVQSS
jgi:hypothetical protein